MRKMKKIIKCAIAVTLLLCANLVYYVFAGQERSAEKLAQGKDLSLYECVSAYQMHTAIWLFGWIIAPEAAMEARLMHVEHKRPVVIYSSFPSLAKPELWKNGVYDLKDPQFQYAAALNGKDLSIEKNEAYTKCELTVEYTDNVQRVGGIPVHTCLFRHLQDIGWLFPYKIVYIDVKTI